MEQESNEQEPNEATEIVGGKVETVEVSRHPEASIPETDLSLADIERRRSHPLRWALIILAVLCAIIAPYWFGRSLAVNNTDSIVAVLGGVSPQGIALVGWVTVVIAYVGLAMAVVVSPSWPWLIVFVIGLAGEQFIAGLSMLNLNFWYPRTWSTVSRPAWRMPRIWALWVRRSASPYMPWCLLVCW